MRRRWEGVDLQQRWPTWRRDVASVAACVVLGWFALVRGGRVPLLSLVDLGFHELGHLVGYVLRPPELVVAALGSLTQVAVPLGLAAYFLTRGSDRAGGAVCLGWASTSAADAAVYVADAPTQQLPLIGGAHDWAFILGPDGLDRLDEAAAWATVVRGGAWLCLLLGVVVALWPVLVGPPVANPGVPPRPVTGAPGRARV